MRELLADLWNDLGISPDVDDFDASPSTKHRHLSNDVTSSKKQPDVTSEASEPVPPPRPAHRQHRSGRSSPSGSPQMPVLKAAAAAAQNRMGQQSKPPLPGGGSVRSQYSICDDDVFEEDEDEDERNAQKETEAMMAAILNNDCNDTLRATADMFEFDLIDTDDIQPTKETRKDSLSSGVVENEQQMFSRGVVVTKEQPTLETARDSPAKRQPSSPGSKKMDEHETSSESVPKEQTAYVKDELPKLNNGVRDRGDAGNGDDDRRDKPTNGDRVHTGTHEPEVTFDREGDIMMQERKLLEDTEKDPPVFNNNENERDTSRSGGTGYTDGGCESQAADTSRSGGTGYTDGGCESQAADTSRSGGTGYTDGGCESQAADTSRSGGTGYTDGGCESQAADDVTDGGDTLRGSGSKAKQDILANHDETGQAVPRPTPRRNVPAASSRATVNDTPKSWGQTASSESLDVSDLDEDDEDF